MTSGDAGRRKDSRSSEDAGSLHCSCRPVTVNSLCPGWQPWQPISARPRQQQRGHRQQAPGGAARGTRAVMYRGQASAPGWRQPSLLLHMLLSLGSSR